MPFSYSTNGFIRQTLEQSLAAIAASGYGGVEILADAPHLYADKITPEYFKCVEQALQSTGLVLANVNANTVAGFYGRTFWEPVFEPSLANQEPRLRRWRIDYTKRCIELCAGLGGSCVSITSGRMVANTPPHKGWSLLLRSLEELLAFAEAHEIRIGLEYEPGLLVESSDELLQILETVDSPWLGANLDVGHAHVCGEDIPEVIGKLEDKIVHVHLEDIRGRKHFHLPPGEGDLDFTSVFRAFSEVGYPGFYTLELYTCTEKPEEVARNALRFLNSLVPQTMEPHHANH